MVQLIDPKTLPKITVPQIAAAVGICVMPVLVLLGVDLNVEQLKAVTVIRDAGLGLFGADAIVRAGRAIGVGLQNKNSNTP